MILLKRFKSASYLRKAFLAIQGEITGQPIVKELKKQHNPKILRFDNSRLAVGSSLHIPGGKLR